MARTVTIKGKENMIGHLMGLLCVCFVTGSLLAAEVTNVKARQRYPWNGLVDIDYTITGEEVEDTSIAVTVTDLETGRVYTPTNFLQVLLPTGVGNHRITWDTLRDTLDLVATNIVVEVSLLKYEGPSVRNDLYCVIDLSGGPDAERWPVSYLSAVPEGGWTDEYKTTKLVLRRIEKGHIFGLERFAETYMQVFDEITITSPYYIGVFEVTSAQYKFIMRTVGYGNYGDKRPQTYVSYDDLRGEGIGIEYPETEVNETCVIGVLKKKTGLAFELPTEAQWEYACRAGTTSYFNNGGSTEADMSLLGRYAGNVYDYKGGFAGGVTAVGAYLPNRWGLYDMHGNVSEWCFDWYDVTIGSRGWRIKRGGGYRQPSGNGAFQIYFSGCRSMGSPDMGGSDDGFRLCINLE